MTMTFQEAILQMEQGARCRRREWLNQWVTTCPGKTISYTEFWNPHAREFAKSQPGGLARVMPYLLCKTPDDTIVMGWQPLSYDVMKDDWEVIPEIQQAAPRVIADPAFHHPV